MALALCLTPFLGGCTAAALGAIQQTGVVDRIKPLLVSDVSGAWNDSDSRETANALITQVLQNQWATRYTRQTGGEPPSVIVGTISDPSGKVQVTPFVRELESALVASEAVRVVASAREREELRGERSDQQQNARRDTRARAGVEQGADFMLKGDVAVFEDARAGVRTVAYQVNVVLVDLETNRKLVFAQHKIKKLVR